MIPTFRYNNAQNIQDIISTPSLKEVFKWDINVDGVTPDINLAGSANAVTSNNNGYVRIVNSGSQTGYFNFEYANLENFRYEVYYKILTGTNQGDNVWFFANGTQTDSGLNVTEGITFNTDYYNGGSFIHKCKLTDGPSNTTILAEQNMGVDDRSGTYGKFTMDKLNNKIKVSLENSQVGIYEREADIVSNSIGTRFGVGSNTGASIINLEIRSVKLSQYV
jgi:hypothetical protein